MKRRPILVLLVFVLCLRPAHAQQTAPPDPGALQKQSEDTFQYYDLQKKLQELRRLKAAEAAKSAPASESAVTGGGKTFLLRHLVISPSELLSAQELASVTTKYENRRISLADLNQLVGDINHLYEKKGDITARAILPPQQIANGEVRITLVEGRVGKISVANKTRTRDSYLLDNIHFNSGEILRVDQLQQNISFLNDTTDLKVKAVLQPGAAFGTSDVELQVEEPANQRTMLFFDNAGRDGVGNERLGLVERYGSLLGFRDPLSVGIYGAAGTIDFSSSYEIPINSYGTRLGASVDDSHIDILSKTTQKFGVAGDSLSASLKFLQPVRMTPRTHMTATFSADYIKSLLQSQNVPLSDTVVRSLDFTINLDIYDRGGLTSIADTLSGGYYGLAGTHDFLKYNSSFVRMQNLRGNVIGLLRISGQYNAFNYLPTVEQFQIGGVATVRGYPEGRQIGDRGYTGTAELQFPSFFRGEGGLASFLRQRLREDIFVDTGAVYDSYRSSRPAGDQRYLTSAGGGLIVSLSRYFSGRFDFGVPLRTTKGIPSAGFHFYIQSTPPLAQWFRSYWRYASPQPEQ